MALGRVVAVGKVLGRGCGSETPRRAGKVLQFVLCIAQPHSDFRGISVLRFFFEELAVGLGRSGMIVGLLLRNSQGVQRVGIEIVLPKGLDESGIRRQRFALFAGVVKCLAPFIQRLFDPRALWVFGLRHRGKRLGGQEKLLFGHLGLAQKKIGLVEQLEFRPILDRFVERLDCLVVLFGAKPAVTQIMLRLRRNAIFGKLLEQFFVRHRRQIRIASVLKLRRLRVKPVGLGVLGRRA